MDHKDTIQEKMARVLADLHAKIDQLNEKVDKLCENTECLEVADQNKASVDKKRKISKYKI